MALRGLHLGALATESARPSWVRAHPRSWQFALGTVCIGAFMGQLDASIVTVAVPTIGRTFSVPVGVASWVGLAYLVALVSTVTACGRLADLRGRKLVYLCGFVVFTISSALCAIAPSFPVLATCRVLQGIGAAMVQANSVAIVALAVPREKLAHALGVQGAAQALGLAAGPSVGGLLLAAGGWRLLFLVNVPIGIVALGLGWFLLPPSSELDHEGRFDRLGLALLAPAVGAGLCALSLGGTRSVGGDVVAALVVVAVGASVAFVAHERRAQAPLVNVALLQSHGLAARLLGAAASYVVLFGMLLAAPFILEQGLHEGAVGSGLTLAAMPAALGVVAMLAGRAHGRFGPRVLTTSGMAVCAAALGVAGVFHGSVVALGVELAMVGCGVGLFTPATNAAVMRAVPRRVAGEASGLLNMARGVGTAVGLALASLVLGASTSTSSGFARTMVVLSALAALTALGSWLVTIDAGGMPGTVRQGRTERRGCTSVRSGA